MNIKTLLLVIVAVLVGLMYTVMSIAEANLLIGIRGGILLVAGIALYFYSKRKKY